MPSASKRLGAEDAFDKVRSVPPLEGWDGTYVRMHTSLLRVDLQVAPDRTSHVELYERPTFLTQPLFHSLKVATLGFSGAGQEAEIVNNVAKNVLRAVLTPSSNVSATDINSLDCYRRTLKSERTRPAGCACLKEPIVVVATL